MLYHAYLVPDFMKFISNGWNLIMNFGASICIMIIIWSWKLIINLFVFEFYA